MGNRACRCDMFIKSATTERKAAGVLSWLAGSMMNQAGPCRAIASGGVFLVKACPLAEWDSSAAYSWEGTVDDATRFRRSFRFGAAASTFH